MSCPSSTVNHSDPVRDRRHQRRKKLVLKALRCRQPLTVEDVLRFGAQRENHGRTRRSTRHRTNGKARRRRSTTRAVGAKGGGRDDPGEPPELVLRFDGACWPNPGPAAYGFVAEQAGKIIASQGAAIGHASSNQAEWRGLIGALEFAKQQGAQRIRVLTDSKLVERQINRAWKVRKPHLKPLYAEARKLVKSFESCQVAWIPREQNTAADRVAEGALR